MFHNYNHENCAVRLKIISINMSCNCQISPLEPPIPSGSPLHPTVLQFQLYRIWRGHLDIEQDNGHKAECAVYFTCKSAFGAPRPPRSFLNVSLFTPSLFIVKAAIIIDMCPAQSTTVYSHFGPCFLAAPTLLENKRRSKHSNYNYVAMSMFFLH